MNQGYKNIIFHIDVNSAFLSWTAVDKIQKGESLIDIREIPSIIAGNSNVRRGIVLAKSIPAKKFKIVTGEPVYSACTKCREISIYPADYKLYIRCSNAMYELLKDYSPLIQRYSIDEVFMDASHFGEDYFKKAKEIKSRIQNELGFTVNIGISTNKLLAKMASDFEKKNCIHTLFKNEIKDKMWCLPASDLFMVGRATKAKLLKLNILTIGDLANYDLTILKSIFKSHGVMLHNFANGIESSKVRDKNYIETKGIGNSTTLPKDIKKRDEALKVLLSLTEIVCMRLRSNESMAKVITVSIKTNDFYKYSHQKTLESEKDCTYDIFKEVSKIFDEA